MAAARFEAERRVRLVETGETGKTVERRTHPKGGWVDTIYLDERRKEPWRDGYYPSASGIRIVYLRPWEYFEVHTG